MNTKRGQANNSSNRIRDFAIEDLWIALNPQTEELAQIIREGMHAEDKDGNPDWNNRHKFIRTVMEYAYGKPSQLVVNRVEGLMDLPKIFYPQKDGE